MTYQMMISIPEDIKEHLKKIPNKSGLITQLLRDYFNKFNNRILSVEELDQELNQLKSNNLNKQIQELENQKSIRLKEQEQAEEEMQKKKEQLLKQYKIWFLEFFDISEKETENLANSFFEVREKTNIYDFGKSQNLKEKKEEIGK